MNNPGLRDNALTKTLDAVAADWQRLDCQSNAIANIDPQVAHELHLLHTIWPRLDVDVRCTLLHVIESMRQQSQADD